LAPGLSRYESFTAAMRSTPSSGKNLIKLFIREKARVFDDSQLFTINAGASKCSTKDRSCTANQRQTL